MHYTSSAKAPRDCAVGCAATTATAAAAVRGGDRSPRVSAVQPHWRQQHAQVSALAAAARAFSRGSITTPTAVAAAAAPTKRRRRRRGGPRHIVAVAVPNRLGRLRAVEVVALQRGVSVLLQMINNHRLDQLHFVPVHEAHGLPQVTRLFTVRFLQEIQEKCGKEREKERERKR